MPPSAVTKMLIKMETTRPTSCRNDAYANDHTKKFKTTSSYIGLCVLKVNQDQL